MWILVLILIISIIAVIIATRSNEDDIDKPKILIITDYVGGVDLLFDRTKCLITLFDDRMEFNFNFKKDMNFYIPINNIIDVKGKTEEQISKDVTLSRLLLTGILAFGLKKTKIKNRKFLVITHNLNNVKENIIFEYNYLEVFIKKYREITKQE